MKCNTFHFFILHFNVLHWYCYISIIITYIGTYIDIVTYTHCYINLLHCLLHTLANQLGLGASHSILISDLFLLDERPNMPFPLSLGFWLFLFVSYLYLFFLIFAFVSYFYFVKIFEGILFQFHFILLIPIFICFCLFWCLFFPMFICFLSHVIISRSACPSVRLFTQWIILTMYFPRLNQNISEYSYLYFWSTKVLKSMYFWPIKVFQSIQLMYFRSIKVFKSIQINVFLVNKSISKYWINVLLV